MVKVTEIWKDIPGYEGYYQASSLGRVKSVDRPLYTSNHNGPYTTTLKGRVLKLFPKNNGYLKIILCKDGIQKTWYVHRLIALTFHSKKIDGFQVDHIDAIRSNNYASNLRICTCSENHRNELTLPRIIANGKKGNAIAAVLNQKKIAQKDSVSHRLIKIFESVRKASSDTSINYSCIRSAAQGRRKSAGGYEWEYINN